MGQGNESEKQRVWSLLSEAGLVDIPRDKFPERIREAKNAVMERLSELLTLTTDLAERDSAAYSLATLKKVEATLQREEKPTNSE